MYVYVGVYIYVCIIKFFFPFQIVPIEFHSNKSKRVALLDIVFPLFKFYSLVCFVL